MNGIHGMVSKGPVSAAERERRLLAMHGAGETDEFIHAVFRLLLATVDCDFVLANLRNIDGVPLVAVDSKGREFGVEYMERFFKLNPSVGYVMRRPGLRLLHTKDHLPVGEELKQLPFYHEFMVPEGWRHSVALLFWGLFPPVPQNAFCVFRSEDQPDFDATDLAKLRAVYPHIATARKRLVKQLKHRSVDDRISSLLSHLHVSATLLDWDLRISHQSQAARRLDAVWKGKAHESLPRNYDLPEEILAVCRMMQEEWREALRHNTSARIERKQLVVHPDKPGLCAEVSLVLQDASLVAQPGFVVHMMDTTQTAPNGIAQLSALTLGEREAVLLAADGLANQEIATQLNITVAAVKLRLHGAFRKLKVASRTQLAVLVR